MKNTFLIIAMMITVFTNVHAQLVMDQPRQIPRIVVTGSAEKEVDPDEIYMTFSLKEYDNKSKEKINIEAITREFLQACTKAGVANEDIVVQQAGGNAYNQWWVRKNKQKPEFRATISYEIKFTDTRKIDGLMPLLNDEAVVNAYVSRVDHSKMEELKKEVKISAVKAAREKADYLASSIGESAGKALLIEEVDFGVMPYVNYRMQANVMMDEGQVGGEQNVAFKKITIKQQVKAEFELR